MAISKLAHFSMRTTALDASRRFYTDVLGFREGFRPPFDFPGALAVPRRRRGRFRRGAPDRHRPATIRAGLVDYLGDKGAGRPARQRRGGPPGLPGDRPARTCTRRLRHAGLDFRERTVPSLGLHQVFVEDPSGVTIELNYPAAEAAGARSIGRAPQLNKRTHQSKKAIVVGGSLGGLFAANLLLRAGWDVQVYERVAEELEGRGAGIVTHPELMAALGAPACASTTRSASRCRSASRSAATAARRLARACRRR